MNIFEAHDQELKIAFLSFLGGIVTGIALGLLIAPQSGEETRERIKEKAENLKESIGTVNNQPNIGTAR
jgi:gas vesicle protein